MPFGKGSKHTEADKIKMRVPHKGSGIYKHKPHTEATKEKIGLNGFHYGMLGKKHTEQWKIENGIRSRKKKGKPIYCIRGENHWNYKGGISTEGVKIRNSIEYNLWRNSIFAKDGYTCQKYGIVGGSLVAHHIRNFAEDKDLRFAIDNGITLSKKAHQEFHKKYGIKNNSREQLLEFLKV